MLGVLKRIRTRCCGLKVRLGRVPWTAFLSDNRENVRRLSHLVQQPSDPVPHHPVMVDEVLEHLEPTPGETYVDMTFGAGGHSTQLLKTVPDIKIFALDRDPVAFSYAKKLAEEYPKQVVPLLGRFSELPQLLCEYKIPLSSIDGFLFDFGCSSMQFDFAERGFSVSKNGPLDMRMDSFRNPEQPTAADVLARTEEEDLARILKVYGNEKRAKQIARAIIETRYTFRKLETTKELGELVNSVLGTETMDTDQLGRFSHKATKTFQALRIFVNNELNEINYGILIAEKYMRIGGRLVTLSFHSLEDTIVKRHITGHVTDHQANPSSMMKFMDYTKSFDTNEMESATNTPWMMLHKHVLIPKESEVEKNPRSRSAKFRAAIKVKEI